MPILPALATQFQCVFPATDHGQERWRWFLLTLQAILVPITASRTSNLLRAIATLFGVQIAPSRYYTFMASVKLRWEALWVVLWRAIPDPLTDGRLLLALDDSINPKTGRKVFGCQSTFDHAAKTNQSRYPWAQTIVTVGLLKVIHGRWCCLPLAFAFYLRLQTLRAGCLRVRGQAMVFQSKFAQAVRLIAVWRGSSARSRSSWWPTVGLATRGCSSRCAPRSGRGRTCSRACGSTPCSTSGPTRLREPRGDRASTGRAWATRHSRPPPCAPRPAPGSANRYGGVRAVLAVERLVMLKTPLCVNLPPYSLV